MTTDAYPIPDLADEREYPDELRERCELLECFCDKGDSRTLLARTRSGEGMAVVKCFLKDSPLYGRTEPAPLKALDAPPMPRFVTEYQGEAMRCVLREYVPGQTLAGLAGAQRLPQAKIIAVKISSMDLAIRMLWSPRMPETIAP